MTGISDISTGGVCVTVADPKVVIIEHLKANASSLIWCTTIPLVTSIPAKQDISLTNRLKQGDEFHQIEVLDHMIITRYGFLSFTDQGLVLGSWQIKAN